ncbi:hypothetical protein [Parasitella parasitica]|uniref:Chromatin modification-related protein n=1 Tax=Parasitella parasitica TaxID=35722 RepID=A0A0B7N6N6_9FUNG|nr:hypothetical protein [Parasitella parasitica]
MSDNTVDIHDDSGRYLQEYIQSLENLPSEIQYHWAEIRDRYDQAKAPERRIKAGQHDLTKIHRQWFTQEFEKKEKLLKHQPAIIQRIQNDYSKLEDLANERISLAEEALKLVDRHLLRLQRDLDKHDQEHPEYAPEPSIPTRSYTIPHGRKNILTETDDTLPEDEAVNNEDDEGEEDEYMVQDDGQDEEKEEEESEKEEEQSRPVVEEKIDPKPTTVVHTPPVKMDPDIQAIIIANRNQKRKKKEARESDKDEPLYCFCQQVSYGEMVACDGENCPYEWFHMDCVGLDEPPKGAWYCSDCTAEIRKRKSSSLPLSKKMKRKKESYHAL